MKQSCRPQLEELGPSNRAPTSCASFEGLEKLKFAPGSAFTLERRESPVRP